MSALRKADYIHLLVVGGLFVGVLIALNIIMGLAPASYNFVISGLAIFWCFPLLAWTQRRRLRGVWRDLNQLAGEAGEKPVENNLISLLLISFVTLFVEMMLIRYIGSQTRIFAFYKNIPLIGAFLGLGSGCFQGKGGRREALLFLAGIAVVALFFAVAAQPLGAMLGVSAALASSERVFGYGFVDTTLASGLLRILSNIHIGIYCVAVFLSLTFIFNQLGRILAVNFEGLPRIRAYSVNILGSLIGLGLFVLLSGLHTSPWLWFLVGLLPLARWLGRGRAARIGILCGVLSALFVAPSLHTTVWSSYQKLVGWQVPHGYQIDISDAFYQVAYDLSAKTVAELGTNPAPHYDYEFAGRPSPERVLIVGAGSGNDVAAALRAGARHVDAVEIDSVIVEMGRLHHPEHPYDDPRVTVILDDARNAFKVLPPKSYDTIVFGLLDSHTQLGTSSVRLDNYVFTQESFAAAARLVRPGGAMVLSVVTAADWLRARFALMMEHACGSPVTVQNFGTSTSYVCRPMVTDPDPGATGKAIGAPIDDWPFPYLPDRGIPLSYGIVLSMLVVASLFWLRRNGIGRFELTPGNAHMFFLGAAFLLMEVYAINRLALLFGTTWLVSAMSVAAMLTEILAANLVVSLARFDVRPYAYAALAVLLIAGWLLGPEVALGKGFAFALGYALFLLSPVFCGGIVFATSFARSPQAGQALGANILGAVLGGWAEYGTMATGIRLMALFALALYAASLVGWLLSAQQGATAVGQTGSEIG